MGKKERGQHSSRHDAAYRGNKHGLDHGPPLGGCFDWRELIYKPWMPHDVLHAEERRVVRRIDGGAE